MSLAPRKLDLLLLAGLCFLCFFWRLGAVGLFDFNEGFYTAAARGMYLRGDYVTARVNGDFFFDKPPLALWCAALSFHLFGVNEFAARFPVAVAASLLVFLIYAFGARCFGRRAGLLSAALLALSPIFFATARQMTMDIHQSFWIAVAMICFFFGCAGETARSKNWYYGFWAGCGMAFMAKSVPGLLPLAVAFGFLCLNERFCARSVLRRIGETKIQIGLPLLIAIIAPWHILAYQANGTVFYQEYWLHHHVGLLTGTDFDHVEPFWFYVPALLVGFFPWSLFLPAAFRKDESSGLPPSSARLLLKVWAALVFLLFSAMPSKLISYLLPMYPAAALLVGDWMARAMEARQARGLRFGALAVSLLAAGGLIGAVIVFRSTLAWHGAAAAQRSVPPPLVDWILHGLGVVAVGTTLAALLVWRARRAWGIGALVGTMAAFSALTVSEGLSAAQRTLNAPLHELARVAGARMEMGAPLALHTASPRRPSVFFYLPASAFVDRPLPPAGEPPVLERGEKSPIDDFLVRRRPAYVLTDVGRARALLEHTPGLIVEQRRDRWVLLRADPVMRARTRIPVVTTSTPNR